jgi:hypothetical protein
MSARSSASAPPPDAGAGIGRRGLALIGGASAVLLALVVGWLALGGDDPQASPRADRTVSSSPSAAVGSATTAPVPSAAATTAPTESVVVELPPALPAVPLDESVAVEDVTVSLPSVERVDARGVGPGNVAGPGVRVTVRVRNDAAADLLLDGVSVNLTYGSESVPGSPVNDDSAAPFGGALRPGGTAEGVYVFSLPAAQRASVAVEVGVRPPERLPAPRDAEEGLRVTRGPSSALRHRSITVRSNIPPDARFACGNSPHRGIPAT